MNTTLRNIFLFNNKFRNVFSRWIAKWIFIEKIFRVFDSKELSLFTLLTGNESFVTVGTPDFHSFNLPSEIRDKIGEYRLPGGRLYRLDNVVLKAPFLIGYYNNRVIKETAVNRNDALRTTLLQTIAYRFKRRNIPQREIPLAISLVSRWSKNYFHWIAECLTRLPVLSNYHSFDLEDSDLKFIIESSSPQWKVDSLVMLGVRIENIITDNKSDFVVKKYILPSYRRFNGITDPISVAWVKQRILSNIVQHKFKKPGLIFISRRLALGRKISNENELRALFQPMGFEFVELEKMSFIDQVVLFANASVIVSPHGAGLTNIIFCQKGTLVIELFGDYINPCYFALAKGQKLIYALLQTGQKDQDLIVNSTDILNLLNEFKGRKINTNEEKDEHQQV